jgi:cellobiose phosphorylase
MLDNAYGRFIDDASAYEITDPDTPSPWTNVVSNGRYGFVVSQNGGGFSWLDHCQLNVITRWNMDHIRDDSGRFVYLRDLDDDGPTWSLSPQPCRVGYDAFRCVHRPGSTTFETSRAGIDAAWTLAVAPEETAEVWSVTLTNTTDRPRRLRLGGSFEWCCGVAPDVKREFHRLFFTTRHDADRRAIVATKNMWEAPFGTADDHWNRPWPHAAGFAIVAEGDHWATADRAAFLGRYGTQADPAGMRERVGTHVGRFVDACAAVGTDLEMAPGESRTVAFVLGVADDAETLGGLLDRFSTIGAVEDAVAGSGGLWDGVLDGGRLRSGMPDMDALTNTWLPYQAISARMWARTGYYQQSGAFGYRDQLQDSQLWLQYDPERCRRQIMLHAAHQFADGAVYHWWNPVTETGLRSKCSDDYLWLPFVAAAYIRETGDAAILDETTPWVDDETPATLREHCLRAIRFSLSRQSERGLPLIGENDWNDGLSHVGTDDAGESVWLAFFLIGVLDEFASALRLAGEAGEADGLLEHRASLKTTVNEHGWDGEWFRRATDADGRWLGSRDSLEGKIFLNAQTWANLTDATDDDRAGAAWESAKAHLLTDYGVLLLAPAYTVPDPKIGYLSRYAPGARENGGVYMHAATWALATACKRRDLDAVERIWRGLSPPLRGRDADAYVAEPYVTPGNVDGPLCETPGKAGWTWYTGSAAWLHRVTMEWILGLRATWEGLRIDPCPFPSMGAVEATRVWRGRRVTVSFDAAAFGPGATPTLTANGETLAGCVLDEATLDRLGREIAIRVSWGAAPAMGEVKMPSAEATTERSGA